MNWKAYKVLLASDLERWVGKGWISAEAQSQILEDVDARKPPSSASPWLALVGITLGGVALIALVADNWGVIPRMMKFGLLLALFWAALAGAVVSEAGNRERTLNGLMLLAGLIFSASLGLLGQSLNMSGDPADTFLFGGLGCFALALASRTSAVGVLAMFLSGQWFISAGDGLIFAQDGGYSRTLALGAVLLLLGQICAFACQSRVIQHLVLAAAGAYLLALLQTYFELDTTGLLAAAIWGGLGVAAAVLARREQIGALTVLGWSAWHMSIGFAVSGVGFNDSLTYKLVWLGLALGTIGVGASVPSGWVLAAGVLSLLVAGFVLLMDLGVELTTAAIIFAIAAAAAGGAAWFLGRSREDGK